MRLSHLCLCLLFSASTFAQDSPVKSSQTKTQEPIANSSVPLPVKKVVLYKNGVGYFEHKGQVRGSQEFGIEFTTAQLNDVLKSLTLVDLNGGAINAVRYNSVAPLGEQLRGLQIPLAEDVTSAAFLIALRGTRVEVRTCGSPKLSAEASERGASWDRGLSTIIAPIQNENSGGHKLEAACAWSVHIYKDRRKVDPE